MATYSNAELVAQIYIGFYDRAPDPVGLNYWIGRLEAGVSIQDIGDSFAASPEAADTYPYIKFPGLFTPDQFLENVYQNVFGRGIDPDGLAYYKARIDSGESLGSVVASIVGNAATNDGSPDQAYLQNKVDAGLYWAQQAAATGADIYQENGRLTDAANASAHGVIDGVTADPATVDAAKAEADAFFAGEYDTFNLTVGTDVATSNVFNAGLEYTPGGNDRVNTLQDEDQLTGRGDNPTLNATLGNANDNGSTVITPTLNGIETINVRFSGSGPNAVNVLDLQDATGVDAVNITGITAPNNSVGVINMTSVPTNLSLSNTNAPAADVAFTFTKAAVSGSDDSTTLTVSNVVVDDLVVQETRATPEEGVEHIALVSTGAENEIGTLWAEDLQDLTITGDQDLTLGDTDAVFNSASGRVEATRANAGLGNVAGSLTTVDASGFEGDLTYFIGSEINATLDGTSGKPVDMTITGGKGNDSFVLTAGANVDANDVIDGGDGENSLTILGGNAYSLAGTGNVKAISDLNVLSGHDAGTGADNITVDADAFTALENIYVRNEGQDYNFGTGRWESASEGMNVTLNNLTADQAQNITLAHGTTGNNGMANNIVNINLKDATGASDSATVTLVDGVNTDPRFNAQIGAAGVENITIVDNDTESNSVLLTQIGSHIGTLTLEGGEAGDFLNLDAGATGGAGRGLYRVNANGSENDGQGIADVSTNANTVRYSGAAIDASGYEGDVIVRVDTLRDAAGVANAIGAQTITMGSGNDTVVFDYVGDVHAGLTISDKVDGGDGYDTLAIDGHGVNITLGASEWTNVKNFEEIRLVGNGQADNNAAGASNAYNLTLTNDLIASNGTAVTGGRSITIVNNNEVWAKAGEADTAGIGVNAGVTIDARSLNAQSSFEYQGRWGMSGVGEETADRFIMADANINGLARIDGGAILGFAGGIHVASNAANSDVLEVRNAAVVTIGDLANVQNVGTLEFTNDTASVQNSLLELDNATVDALVNSSQTASVTSTETLVIRAVDNPLVAGANTVLTVDATQVTNAGLQLEIHGGGGSDTITGGAGNDWIAGNGGVDTIHLGAVNGGGNDIVFFGAENLTSADADLITGFTAGSGTGFDALQIEVATVAGGSVATLAAAIVDIAGSADNSIIVDQANTGYADFATAEAAVDAANANTLSYLVVFHNTTSNNIEVWADDDSGAAGGTMLGSFTDVATVGTFLNSLNLSNFDLV